MSTRLDRVEADVYADHGTIELLDLGGEVEYPTGGDRLRLADNAIVIVAAGAEDVDVAVERWDAEPPAPDGAPALGAGEVRLATGELGVNPLVEGEGTVGMTVPAGRYAVRLLAAGDGYLVQLWPAN